MGTNFYLNKEKSSNKKHTTTVEKTHIGKRSSIGNGKCRFIFTDYYTNWVEYLEENINTFDVITDEYGSEYLISEFLDEIKDFSFSISCNEFC